MVELVQENWILFLIALLIGIAIAWWVFVASRRVRVESNRRDTLDEGAERATRNQALIDAPPAAAAGYSEIPPATPIGLAGAGEAVADAAEPVRETPQAREVEKPAPPPEPIREEEKRQDIEAPPVEPVRKTDETDGPASTPVVAPTPEPAPSPERAEPAPGPAEAETPAADDLRRIKGVGPKLEQTLHSLGVNSFAQIASWDDAEIDRIDAQLGKFQGRIRRDQWVEQARLLVAGDQAGYESRFGRV